MDPQNSKPQEPTNPEQNFSPISIAETLQPSRQQKKIPIVIIIIGLFLILSVGVGAYWLGKTSKPSTNVSLITPTEVKKPTLPSEIPNTTSPTITLSSYDFVLKNVKEIIMAEGKLIKYPNNFDFSIFSNLYCIDKQILVDKKDDLLKLYPNFKSDVDEYFKMNPPDNTSPGDDAFEWLDICKNTNNLFILFEYYPFHQGGGSNFNTLPHLAVIDIKNNKTKMYYDLSAKLWSNNKGMSCNELIATASKIDSTIYLSCYGGFDKYVIDYVIDYDLDNETFSELLSCKKTLCFSEDTSCKNEMICVDKNGVEYYRGPLDEN